MASMDFLLFNSTHQLYNIYFVRSGLTYFACAIIFNSWSGGEKIGTYEGHREWNDLLAWIDRGGQPLPVAEAEETDDVEDVHEVHVHEEL